MSTSGAQVMRTPCVLTAVAKREVLALFTSPIGVVLIACFVAAMAMLALYVMPQAGRGGGDWFAAKQLTMASFFDAFPWVAAVVTPALSMRAWPEDVRGGTWQLLATLPQPIWRVVLGKFVAYALFAALMLGATAVFPVMVLSAQGSEGLAGEGAAMLGGYLGCWMLALAFLAVGMFISSLTRSQMAAYIASLLVCGALVAWRSFAGLAADSGGGSTAAVLSYVSVEGHFSDIAHGRLRFEGLVWYGSLTGLFLWLNTTVLEFGRHR